MVFVTVNLHVLRNLSPAYLGLYGIVTVWTVWHFIDRAAWRRFRLAGPVTWILMSLSGFVATAASSDLAAAGFGLSRFLFCVPIFLGLAAFTDDHRDARHHLETFVVFFAVAAATLPMQFVTGPIGFFANQSERGGLTRYASLVGSLTAVGVVGGCYVAMAHGVRARLRVPVIVIIAVSLMTSLSKAAIANLILGIAAFALLERRILPLLRGALALAIAAIPALFIPAVGDRLAVVLSSFGISLDGTPVSNDVSVIQSGIDRLTTLPAMNIAALDDLRSMMVYLVGGGFGMGNTALVPEDAVLAPMAHNQFVEMFTVFGLVPTVAGLVVIGAAVWRLVQRRQESSVHAAVLAALVLLLANSIFANGTFYQPSAASILMLAFFLATSTVASPGATARARHPS